MVIFMIIIYYKTIIEIKHYQLKNILIKLNHKKYHKWSQKEMIHRIRRKTAVSFISSKYLDEELAMHSKSDNIEIIINDEEDEVIEERFK